jgi:hypothetical protein
MFQTEVVEKIERHILCPLTRFENRAVYETMWKNILQPDKPHENTAHALSCWIPKVTSPHSECVTLVAFPLQQWLRERVLMLRCPDTACIVLLFYRQRQGNKF